MAQLKADYDSLFDLCRTGDEVAERVAVGDDDADGDDNRHTEGQSNKFIWILKSVRSIQAETRFEEMLHEVSDCAWDLLAINETWMEETEEIFKLESRYTCFGSGGVAGKQGVAVLLNERWVSSNISKVVLTGFRWMW